ncbi:MAG: hypothetical protein JWN56_2206 [Sphingobacteriales bacterium]|nr:hypothetical protein [Sphingobacteriales bacterium]
MKRISLIIIFLISTSLIAYSQDNFLMPDKFLPAKGDSLKIRLLTAKSLKDPKELTYNSAKVSDFWLFDSNKKTDLKSKTSEDASPVLMKKIEEPGLALVGLNSAPTVRSMPKSRFADYLKEQGLDEISKQFESNKKPFVKERITWFCKTLVKAEKNSRGIFDEKVGQQLEIVLLQNPYKLKYGDDMTAQVLLEGKQLKNANVEVLTLTANGAIFTNSYRTDDDGKVYFKVNRTGTWLIRLIQMSASKDTTADYESIGASFTFGFETQL